MGDKPMTTARMGHMLGVVADRFEGRGECMSHARNTGRDPTPEDLAAARRVAALPIEAQRQHPSALPADRSKLDHINTYGSLPEFYIDRRFRCRDCGKEEIWKAADQKWYYETAKGHMDARAVRCHACRQARRNR